MENSPLEDGCIGNQVASELDPYKPPFINVVSNEDEKHESKGLKIVLSKTVAWGTKPLVSFIYRIVIDWIINFIICFLMQSRQPILANIVREVLRPRQRKIYLTDESG